MALNVETLGGVRIAIADSLDTDIEHAHGYMFNAQGAAASMPVFAPPPEQLASFIQQYRLLIDNDLVITDLPEGNFTLPAHPSSFEALSAMNAQAAHSGGALWSQPAATDHDAMSGFGAKLHAQMQDTRGESVVAHAPRLEGQWVNGVQQPEGTQAPLLQDFLPREIDAQKVLGEQATPASAPITPAPTTSPASAQDTQAHDCDMDIVTGANVSANNASVMGASLTGTVWSVAGDVYTIDVIAQTNMLSNIDQISASYMSALDLAVRPDVAVNLASVKHHAPAAAPSSASEGAMPFPENWQITAVDGDLSFFNWFYQNSFTVDDDMLVVSATGSNTTIGTGANMGFQAANLAHIGQAYDLILVGGSLYNVNYITQTNILYDDDILDVVSGDIGHGTFSSGGNLLWNQASIDHFGVQDWKNGLPEGHLAAMNGLAGDTYNYPAALGEDPAFAGLGTLKVLYVSGSIYDITYLEQVNVMGDADHVMLHARNTLDDQAHWTVSTGANALINGAQITDYNGLGAGGYVGGAHYSDAMLIQCEIIDTNTDIARPGAPLASEIVAFLDDGVDEGTPDYAIAPTTHAIPTDPMESILA